jgi:hypothetical protein
MPAEFRISSTEANDDVIGRIANGAFAAIAAGRRSPSCSWRWLLASKS